MTDGGNGSMEVQDARKKPRHTVAVSPICCVCLHQLRQANCMKTGQNLIESLRPEFQTPADVQIRQPAVSQLRSVCQDCMLRARTPLALES